MTSSELTLPQNLSFFSLLPQTLAHVLSPCSYSPLSLLPLCLPSSPFTPVPLSPPALLVMQLVVLKVWSVVHLVGEEERRGRGGWGVPLGTCAVSLNMLCFPQRHTKDSSLIKRLCFSSPYVPNTHRPGPKTQTTEGERERERPSALGTAPFSVEVNNRFTQG